ncbi:Uncharacterized conserved protein [Phaffia rhodozyma]|uniref:Chromatin modification-related protein EAF6 n=1 Tax=Phaffia rhodozyma TaxID=264483 RepID=A0A0F7ST36_PHARH|nr:Uncharacterized conserved protein [Phaffia rhodozyma]
MSNIPNAADPRVVAEKAKNDLILALQRKRQIEKQLINTEGKIYAFEGSYLEECGQNTGNIFKGFNDYLKPPTAGGAHKKKYEVTDADRLFSGSSVSFTKSLEAKTESR